MLISLIACLKLPELSCLLIKGLDMKELYKLILVNHACARNFIPQLWRDPFEAYRNNDIYKIKIVCILLNRLDNLDINFNDIYGSKKFENKPLFPYERYLQNLDTYQIVNMLYLLIQFKLLEVYKNEKNTGSVTEKKYNLACEIFK
ncbi:hypothetical protein F8M41_001957 [Gigaspora margarita]|uniref:Uncharacterized protein n=1 Tax=Gigaspora margarita TaxID=4874 RepID=A0A8H3XDL4_GIGMA|nr:hypothetical protein F8M41_001957 [Gigaspora margarita]